MSNVALWGIVLFETVLLLLLLRALGELKQKGFPTAGQDDSTIESLALEIGEQAPSFEAVDQHGSTVRLEEVQARQRILAFVFPGCPACATAMETLNSLVQEEHDLAVLVVGGTDKAANCAYAVEHNAQMPLVTSPAGFARDSYGVHVVPFVFALDSVGAIRAKGAVSHQEDVRNLLNTAFAATEVAL